MIRSDLRTPIVSIAAPTTVRVLGLPDDLKYKKHGSLKRGDDIVLEGIEPILKLKSQRGRSECDGIKGKITTAFLLSEWHHTGGGAVEFHHE